MGHKNGPHRGGHPRNEALGLGECAVEGCHFNVLALGLCKMHYDFRVDAERREAKRRIAEGELVVHGKLLGRDVNNKGGHPIAPFKSDPKTFKQLRSLGKIQCTVSEAASVLLCSYECLQAFLSENEEAAECFFGGREQGKVSLRRTQFTMSKKSAAMGIWLGKQYLNQREPGLTPLLGGMSDELGGEPPTALLRAVREETE